jgi:hypothetical protein
MKNIYSCLSPIINRNNLRDNCEITWNSTFGLSFCNLSISLSELIGNGDNVILVREQICVN